MNKDVCEVEFIDQTGLSPLTFQIKNVRPQVVSRTWKAKSQPAKLLGLSLLIMTCLCGSIYYGTMDPTPSTPHARSLPK